MVDDRREESGISDSNPSTFLSRCKDLSLRAFYFFQLNGGYFALYGLMIPSILMNVFSAIFNEFQGGCLFPYLSEVGREGYNRVIFVASTLIVMVPWLIFSTYFMFTSWQYAQFVIPNIIHRGIFDLCHLIIFILTTHSNVYFFLTSVFDILNFPDYHSSATTKLALYGCTAYIFDTVCCFFYLKSPWKKLKWRKLVLLVLSWTCALTFALLFYVEGCPAQILSMDNCFTQTAEEYCFSKQDPENTAMTILRYYPNCAVLNFVRGVSEYLTLLFALSYFSFFRGDIIIEQYEMCKWRYLNKISENHGNRKRRPSQLSEIEDENEREHLNEKENEAVKEMIANTTNPFLLKYIKHYWEDYDSVKSNVEIDGSFNLLTERELNQLENKNLI